MTTWELVRDSTNDDGLMLTEKETIEADSVEFMDSGTIIFNRQIGPHLGDSLICAFSGHEWRSVRKVINDG